jgi:hypothetical protein
MMNVGERGVMRAVGADNDAGGRRLRTGRRLAAQAPCVTAFPGPKPGPEISAVR